MHFTDSFQQKLSIYGRAAQTHRFQKRDFASTQIQFASHDTFSSANLSSVESKGKLSRSVSAGLFHQERLRVLLDPIPHCFEPRAHLYFDLVKLVLAKFSVSRPLLAKNVILDLWFRSRTAHCNPGPVRQLEDQHLLLGNLIALHIPDAVCLKISNVCHFRSEYLGGRCFRVGGEQAFDLPCALRALEVKRSVLLGKISESAKDFVEQLIDRLIS